MSVFLSGRGSRAAGVVEASCASAGVLRSDNQREVHRSLNLWGMVIRAVGPGQYETFQGVNAMGSIEQGQEMKSGEQACIPARRFSFPDSGGYPTGQVTPVPFNPQ